MATQLPERERLQPALLDRLIDDHPDQRSEPAEGRVISRAQLRESVLRDLVWLLNAVKPGVIDAVRHPHAAASVLNYGLPAMSGEQASTVDIAGLEEAMRQAILAFEPRILSASLRVRALEMQSVLDTHNQVRIEITGNLWAQPVPLEFLVRTELDLETGQIDVRETRAG